MRKYHSPAKPVRGRANSSSVVSTSFFTDPSSNTSKGLRARRFRAEDTLRVEVPLKGGRRAVIALPEDVTAADTKAICAILGTYAEVVASP